MALVVAVIDLLIGKTVSLLENERTLLQGVSEKLDEIKLELTAIKSFLEDVDGKSSSFTKVEKTWVASVRDLGYNVEDIIDEFLYCTNYHQQQSRNYLFSFIRQSAYIPKNLWLRHQFAVKLDKIIAKLNVVPERNKRYATDQTGVQGKNTIYDNYKWVQNYGETSLFLKDEEVVGIEEDKQKLIELLDGQQQDLTAISLVGMGGLGKTTLAAKIYNSNIVRRKFHCYAWIIVSQTYVKEELIKCLIKELYRSRKEKVATNLDVMSHRELIDMMVNYLEAKRYLVILDDVWDVNLWLNLKAALPDNRCGSRIIFTTRNEVVGSSWGIQKHIHHMQPLPDSEAWKLFSMKAFLNYPGKCCPEYLEPIAWKLVVKCGGLPLALVALGGLMSTKDSKPEWIRVCNNLNWQINQNPMLESVKNILLLSFYELPCRLKHCLLYSALFPEDYLISRSRLAKLWIAEGLVEHVKGVTLEDAAEGYLMELISRSMLQFVSWKESGWQRPCKLHDLVRELALSISEGEKLLAVYDGKEELQQCQVRHLSIQTSEKDLQLPIGVTPLRSFLAFGAHKLSHPTLRTLLSKSKLLRVLDMENVPIVSLPKELGFLFNLRYLNLRRTSICELPKSIGNLYNLETLDIRETKIEALPKGIARLSRLRHLLALRYCLGHEDNFKFSEGAKVTGKICKLKSLQDVDCIESSENFIKQVGEMTQLIRIGISNIRGKDATNICLSIQNLKLLKYLSLLVADEEENLCLDALTSPPPELQVVVLFGKLENVPHWFSSLYSLTSMILHWSRLEENPLTHLATLPSLRQLTLVNAYVREELHFQQGFPKLKMLSLKKFPQLKAITIANGAMIGLQVLSLQSFNELKTLPQGIEHLLKLQRLVFKFVPMELIDSIREGGVYRQMVQHVPDIDHYYETSSGTCYERLV